MNLTIRLADSADVTIMAEIISRSWEVAYKDIIPAEYIKESNSTRPARCAQHFAANQDKHFVIQADERIVGTMWIAPLSEDEAKNNGVDSSFYELVALYLLPDYYHKGIGTVAMNFAIQKARSAGKSNMIVWVLEENISAISFYKKCGFTADGASKPHSYGKELTLIRMRRGI